ncbi:hypothetical protein B0T16DRAFT_75322 [Cercophora newfieldiana]|uniref:Uncharacterized protein n=1 Tax=Cercophora newfieldiana TaxID=92897 RepID=A0AA40CUJ7_9PEZI|nr:hypothetical protein B0T16DRAFT_75322 [Cercophora newfieldiana]
MQNRPSNPLFPRLQAPSLGTLAQGQVNTSTVPGFATSTVLHRTAFPSPFSLFWLFWGRRRPDLDYGGVTRWCACSPAWRAVRYCPAATSGGGGRGVRLASERQETQRRKCALAREQNKRFLLTCFYFIIHLSILGYLSLLHPSPLWLALATVILPTRNTLCRVDLGFAPTSLGTPFRMRKATRLRAGIMVWEIPHARHRQLEMMYLLVFVLLGQSVCLTDDGSETPAGRFFPPLQLRAAGESRFVGGGGGWDKIRRDDNCSPA